MKELIITLLLLAGTFAYSQQIPAGAVEMGDDTFLPSRKGNVVNRLDRTNSTAQKIFSILQSCSVIREPLGYEVKAISSSENMNLQVFLMPYVFRDEEIMRLPGSSLTLHFNNINAIFALPVQSGIADIYTAPVISGEFRGYAIYEHEGQESTAIYKGSEPLFLPVSQEDYLQAVIQNEQKKQLSYGTSISVDESLKEMEKAYNALLKVDKVAAAEFKHEMDSYRKDAALNAETGDMVASCKRELARLSPEERKRQAYFAIFAMEKYGNYSGLVPLNDTANAKPLVKPNHKLMQPAKGIGLLTVIWKLSDKQYGGSPRFYDVKNTAGFALTDDRLLELYNNDALWDEIIQEVN